VDGVAWRCFVLVVRRDRRPWVARIRLGVQSYSGRHRALGRTPATHLGIRQDYEASESAYLVVKDWGHFTDIISVSYHSDFYFSEKHNSF